MERVVWSTGEKYDISLKSDNPVFAPKKTVSEKVITSDEHILRRNYRENSKLHNEDYIDRQMIQRAHQNPFFNDNNYIDVLDAQDKFLTPINSNNANEEEPAELPYNKSN